MNDPGYTRVLADIDREIEAERATPKDDPSDGDLEPSEEDLALLFTDQNPNLRYVAILGQWLTYEETRWKEDTTLAVFDMVRALVRETSKGTKTPAKLCRANTVTAVERLAKADRRHAATVDLFYGGGQGQGGSPGIGACEGFIAQKYRLVHSQR